MPLVEDDHVVETLTSNGADHPFDKWILPRGARCGKYLLYPETVDASIEVRSVDLISIPYQVPRRRPVCPMEKHRPFAAPSTRRKDAR